jgi:hypothetical protein
MNEATTMNSYLEAQKASSYKLIHTIGAVKTVYDQAAIWADWYNVGVRESLFLPW